MGRTYYAKGTKDRATFDVNFSGADILGHIMKAVDENSKPIEERNLIHGLDNFPCTRFQMPPTHCARAVAKLKQLTDAQYNDIWEKCKWCFEPTADIKELKDFTQEWIAFLKKCKKGYTVPS